MMNILSPNALLGVRKLLDNKQISTFYLWNFYTNRFELRIAYTIQHVENITADDPSWDYLFNIVNIIKYTKKSFLHWRKHKLDIWNKCYNEKQAISLIESYESCILSISYLYNFLLRYMIVSYKKVIYWGIGIPQVH